ncbi:MAG: hypothetical protein CMH83_13560 [Nocardioides sp.]|nr:hypothetical protein [Nocardioides sp.]
MTRFLARSREERGSALVEVVWVGILLLVPLMWVVLTAFDVQKGAFGTSTAARSAARAFALAPDDASGRRAAREAARTALDDQGLPDAPVRVDVTCETPVPGNCHAGTAVITVTVDSDVAVPFLPEVLDGGRAHVGVDSSHTVPIGRYREVSGG